MWWQSKFFCLFLAKLANDVTIVITDVFPMNQIPVSLVTYGVLFRLCQLPRFKANLRLMHPYRFVAMFLLTLVGYDLVYGMFHSAMHQSDILYENVHYFHHEKLPPLRGYYTLHVHFVEVLIVTLAQVGLAWFGNYYVNNLVLPLVQLHSVLIHSGYETKDLFLGTQEHWAHHEGEPHFSLFFNFGLLTK